jgi:hypothetical protein
MLVTFVTFVTCREDAFQEYVELETVYLDTLEAAAAAAAAATATPAEAAAAAVRDAADFGEETFAGCHAI